MRFKDLFYILGVRPRARVYAHRVVTFELPQDGAVQYAQWLHPKETRKVIRQDTLDELRKFIAPGDVAIDIGAHTGYTALLFALAAGPYGCVLALEPNPYVFPVLEKNAELNRGKANIIPLMIAATAEPGEFSFEYSDPGFCNGGLHEGVSRWRHGHAFRLKVRGENLQSYLAEHSPELVPRIRFVKIDVEGYDYRVLTSLTDLVRRQKPFLKVEVFKHLDLGQRERLFDLLVGLGYDVFLVESDANYLGQKLERTQLMLRSHYDVFGVPTRGSGG